MNSVTHAATQTKTQLQQKRNSKQNPGKPEYRLDDILEDATQTNSKSIQLGKNSIKRSTTQKINYITNP